MNTKNRYDYSEPKLLIQEPKKQFESNKENNINHNFNKESFTNEDNNNLVYLNNSGNESNRQNQKEEVIEENKYQDYEGYESNNQNQNQREYNIEENNYKDYAANESNEQNQNHREYTLDDNKYKNLENPFTPPELEQNNETERKKEKMMERINRGRENRAEEVEDRTKYRKSKAIQKIANQLGKHIFGEDHSDDSI